MLPFGINELPHFQPEDPLKVRLKFLFTLSTVALALCVASQLPENALAETGEAVASSEQALATLDGIADKVPPEIKEIVKTAKEIAGIYGDVRTALDVASRVLRVLGIIESKKQENLYEQLAAYIDQLGARLSWHEDAKDRDHRLSVLENALESANTSLSHGSLLARDSNPDWDSRIAVSDAEKSSACERYDQPKAVVGDWQKIISRRAPVSNGFTYDWRLGVPALMQLVALRVQVMAAIDPGFRSVESYNELKKHRDALRAHYDKMLSGIECATDWCTGGCKLGLPCTWCVDAVACADIYTGTSATAISNAMPWNTRDARIEEARQEAYDEVYRKLPLFELRSLIDSLTLYMTGVKDLTAKYQRIPVSHAPSLCLDVQWGNLAAGTPVWLWDCNGGDAQWWVYDRQRGTIVNPPSGKCLDVQWGSTTPGTPVWLWDCNGGDAQRWTYDPETRVLENALGTVLDIQWGNLQAGTPVWTWPRNEGWAQQWRADQELPRRAPIPVQPQNP
jgi:hypothetical protein